MNWQDGIVIAVAIAVLGEIVRRMIGVFRRSSSGKTPCSDCTADCSLRQILPDAHPPCGKNALKQRKK